MGVEYYLIKPRTAEMFYLGKGSWRSMEEMPDIKARKTEYNDYVDILADMVRAGCYTQEDTMEFMTQLAYEIFDFQEEDEVQLVSDCDNDTEWLAAYKEVKSIIDIAEEIYKEKE